MPIRNRSKKATLRSMNHRVVVQKKRYTGAGNTHAVWDDVRELWASIAPNTSNEVYLEGSIQHTVSHVIKVRYQSDIDFHSGVRIKYGDRTFKILGAINPGEVGQFQRLSVNEGVAT